MIFPLSVPYKFSNFLSNAVGGNEKSDLHNHSLGSLCFQSSDKEGEMKKALSVLLHRNSTGNGSNTVYY